MELLGDLPVGSASLGKLGDGRLRGAELVRFAGTGAPAGSPPFNPGTVSVPIGATRLCDAQRLSKQLARFGLFTTKGEESTVVGQGLSAHQWHGQLFMKLQRLSEVGLSGCPVAGVLRKGGLAGSNSDFWPSSR